MCLFGNAMVFSSSFLAYFLMSSSLKSQFLGTYIRYNYILNHFQQISKSTFSKKLHSNAIQWILKPILIYFFIGMLHYIHIQWRIKKGMSSHQKKKKKGMSYIF
jgi:hypothetical protein